MTGEDKERHRWENRQNYRLPKIQRHIFSNNNTYMQVNHAKSSKQEKNCDGV